MYKEKGGVLQPDYTCPKTGLPVLDVLRPKHPETLRPLAHSLEAYRNKPPAMVPVDITDTMVATVARRLSGLAGTGRGVDFISL